MLTNLLFMKHHIMYETLKQYCGMSSVMQPKHKNTTLNNSHLSLFYIIIIRRLLPSNG